MDDAGPGRAAPGEVPAPPGEARRARLKRLAASAVIVGCLAVTASVYSQQGFDLDPRTLRERIDGFGWLAPLAYVLAAALRPFLFLPSWVIMSAGGLAFGIAGGVLWGSIGFTLGAVLAFSIARALGRDVVASRLQGRASRFDEYVSQRGAPWIALYTAVPVSVLTPVHTGAGLSGMSLAMFAFAAIGGFVPRTAIYSLFGDSIAQGDWSRAGIVLGVIVIGGGAGIVAAQRWGRARAERERQAMADQGPGPS